MATNYDLSGFAANPFDKSVKDSGGSSLFKQQHAWFSTAQKEYNTALTGIQNLNTVDEVNALQKSITGNINDQIGFNKYLPMFDFVRDEINTRTTNANVQRKKEEVAAAEATVQAEREAKSAADLIVRQKAEQEAALIAEQEAAQSAQDAQSATNEAARARRGNADDLRRSLLLRSYLARQSDKDKSLLGNYSSSLLSRVQNARQAYNDYG